MSFLVAIDRSMIANILVTPSAIHLTEGDDRIKRFQMCLPSSNIFKFDTIGIVARSTSY